VIAAGFDGGAPAYKPAEAPRKVATRADTPMPTSAPPVSPATPPPARRVLFDDVDVPDFLKNGS
jgi:cell division protein FtsZ